MGDCQVANQGWVELVCQEFLKAGDESGCAPTNMILPTVTRQLLTSTVVRGFVVFLFISVGLGCTPAAKRSHALQRAEHYFKNGDYDKARIEYLNLLRLDQMNPTAIKQLGTIWFEDGDPLRALPYLKAARDLDPNNLDIRRKLASALLMLGEPVEARTQAFSLLRQPQ